MFLQWVDSVSQLMRMYPCAFEFSPVCTKAHTFFQTIPVTNSTCSKNRSRLPLGVRLVGKSDLNKTVFLK